MAKGENNKTRIEILCSEGIKEDGVLKIPITILCSRGDQPLSGESVNIFVNEKPQSGPNLIEEDGRVVTMISVPLGSKSITIDAQLVGTTKHGRKTVPIISEEKKQLKKAKIVTFDNGQSGDCIVTFQVDNADSTPMVGVIIRVFDTDHPEMYFDLAPTNKDGITTHRFQFSVKRKVVRIEVLGHPETSRQLNLFY